MKQPTDSERKQFRTYMAPRRTLLETCRGTIKSYLSADTANNAKGSMPYKKSVQLVVVKIVFWFLKFDP